MGAKRKSRRCRMPWCSSSPEEGRMFCDGLDGVQFNASAEGKRVAAAAKRYRGERRMEHGAAVLESALADYVTRWELEKRR